MSFEANYSRGLWLIIRPSDLGSGSQAEAALGARYSRGGWWVDMDWAFVDGMGYADGLGMDKGIEAESFDSHQKHS